MFGAAGRVVSSVVGVCCAIGVAASPAVGEPRPVVEMYFGGAGALFDDGVDAGLAEAWELAGERLAELPGELRELTGDPLPGADEVARLLSMLRWGELAVEAGMDFERLSPSVAVALWPGEGSEAADVSALVRGLLEGAGVRFAEPSGREGMYLLEGVEGPPLMLGAQELVGDDAFVVTVDRDPMGVGRGVERGGSIFRGMVDLRRADVPEGMIGDPSAAGLLRFVGAIGEDAWRVRWDVRRERGKLVADSRAMGAEAAAGRLGIGRDVLLDPSVMRVVPRDATYVAAFAYDFGGVPGVIRSALRSAGAPMEELEEEQGFRTAMGFVDSLSAALGDDVVIYRSMSTGGGGPLSAVVSVGVSDEASMERWLDRLAGLASGAGAQFLRGYANVRKHEIEGAAAWSLRSAGVPLPVDLTVALGDGRLTMGATSGTVRSAVRQLGGEGLSVRENPLFRRSMGPAMGGGVELIALQWRDMGWHAERAYGVAELLGTAVENGVRQRYGGPRDPGDIVPGFAEFTADVEMAQ